MGWWCPAAGLEALSVAVHAWDLLRQVTIIFINSTTELPELTPDWKIDSQRAQQNFMQQDPEERSSDPKTD